MYLDKTISEISDLIRSKKLSSFELVSFYCNRIKLINPKINAIIQFDEEKALAKAKELDKLLEDGIWLGILHGIPFTAKDWLETKDFISVAGYENRLNYLPKENATVIERLEKAGAILLGKTNVPYHGSEATNNPLFGTTNNPYNLDYTPGWSSGGEAAAIAAGCSPFGLGSDSGGSARTPAHFCGIPSLKPNTGRIPSTGHFPEIGGFLDPRSQISPMSRHVEDLAIIYDIIRGPDGKDPYVVETPVFLAPELSNLKIGYYINHDKLYPVQSISKAIEKTIDFLTPAVNIIEFNEPSALKNVMQITNGCWDMYKNKLSSQEILQLFKNWDNFRKEMWEYMQNYDALITPVTTHNAHPHKATPPDYIPYTLTYSLLGWPCATVRVGTSEEGLPINVQVVAHPYHEETCLLIAEHLENMCGWQIPELGVV